MTDFVPAERTLRKAPPVERRIAALAASQHGVVTRAQLLDDCLSRSAITRRVQRGLLHAVHRGVYAVGHPNLSQEGQWMAGVLAGGEGAALGHLPAVVLWQAWRRRPPVWVDVVTPTQRRDRGRVRFHEACNLDPLDVTTHRGIPVTTIPRTLVDLTDILTAHQLANVIHEAAFRGRFNETNVRAAMARANGRRNLDVLDKALHLHAQGSAGTRSDLEDTHLARQLKEGKPEPRVNTHVQAGGQEIEVDFYWPDRKLIVEIDGPGHKRPRTQREDEIRDHLLRDAGFQVVRLKQAG